MSPGCGTINIKFPDGVGCGTINIIFQDGVGHHWAYKETSWRVKRGFLGFRDILGSGLLSAWAKWVLSKGFRDIESFGILGF